MIQRNFKLCNFSIHSVCFLQNFFFRSEQKFLPVLYHCAKFYKFSPSTFRDIFDQNINFAKFSSVQDRWICTCMSLVCLRELAQSAAQAMRAKKIFRATLTRKVGGNMVINIKYKNGKYDNENMHIHTKSSSL